MEIITDIFITLFLMVIVGGGFWCLLKLWGCLWDYPLKSTFLDDLNKRN